MNKISLRKQKLQATPSIDEVIRDSEFMKELEEVIIDESESKKVIG